jgi:hypothetical protein
MSGREVGGGSARKRPSSLLLVLVLVSQRFAAVRAQCSSYSASSACNADPICTWDWFYSVGQCSTFDTYAYRGKCYGRKECKLPKQDHDYTNGALAWGKLASLTPSDRSRVWPDLTASTQTRWLWWMKNAHAQTRTSFPTHARLFPAAFRRSSNVLQTRTATGWLTFSAAQPAPTRRPTLGTRTQLAVWNRTPGNSAPPATTPTPP